MRWPPRKASSTASAPTTSRRWPPGWRRTRSTAAAARVRRPRGAPTQTLIYMEELARQRIPRSLHFPGYAIAAPSLLEFGDDEQKALAPASIRGDLVWCIGMSEPNAGSDLASLTTRAVQDGADGPFIVNGQKVWTSYSMIAEKCFCYVRTDPSAPKHKGISVLIIDMDTPGIDVRPLRHLTG